jgi:hypothetical protein
VITEVAASDPVVGEGRTVTPMLICSLAAAAAGQVPSFARLMGDATRGLEQARRDGTMLAISISHGGER